MAMLNNKMVIHIYVNNILCLYNPYVSIVFHAWELFATYI